MSEPRSQVDPRAAEIYFEFVARRDAGEVVDFDALCRAHPERAAALREIRSAHELAQAMFQASAAERSIPEQLRARFGAEVDPAIELDRGESRSPEAPPRSLVERLREQGPRGTRYRILGEVARGGMGLVLKVWDGDLRRSLAMKVALGRSATAREPEPGPKSLGRFLEEAQITGQLDHPGIVPVHELGLGADGRVYFTMRLVKGVDLRRVLEMVARGEEGWNPTRALGVLLRVCEAMSYAHAKGVIHRDLKPANVMVGKFGEVYVMDWGLARVLAREDRHDLRIRPQSSQPQSVVRTERDAAREVTPDSPLVTMDGDVVGTPSFMPPEQARGELERLGPWSDVYALGAMLYQLVAGEMPYVPRGARVSPHAILARVVEGPPRPLAELAPDAPPELAAICARAMAREPEHRYPDVQALADDLRAYLEGRVVLAYRTGAWAETRKWVQRNRALAASLAAAAAILAGGGVTSTIFAVQAHESAIDARDAARMADALRGDEAEQRRRAELASAAALAAKEEAQRRADETELVSDFQARMLSDLAPDEFGHALVLELERGVRDELARRGASEPETIEALERLRAAIAPANATTVAMRLIEGQMLDRALATIDGEFREQPLVRASLAVSLGRTALDLGLYDLAERALPPAVEVLRRDLGERRHETLAARGYLASLRLRQGRYDEAEPEFRAIVAARREILGDGDADTLTAVNNLALHLSERGRADEAEALYRDALARRGDMAGPPSKTVLTVINNLAILLAGKKALAEAEVLSREAVAGFRATSGERSRDALNAAATLAAVLQGLGRLDEAGERWREVLAGRRALLGDDHPETLSAVNNLATVYRAAGDLERAEPLYREALAGLRLRLGNDHSGTLAALSNLALLLKSRGKLDEAEPLYREALEGMRSTLGAEHPQTLVTTSNLASLLHSRGNRAEAEALYREVLASRRARFGDDHADTLNTMRLLAAVLTAERKYAGALELLLTAAERTEATAGTDSELFAKCAKALVDVYERWHAAEPERGLDREAARWRARLPAATGE